MLRTGGCYVTARVYPATAQAGEADVVPVEVQDNEDGTYSGTYTVPRRGDYEVCPALSCGTPPRCFSCMCTGRLHALPLLLSCPAFIQPSCTLRSQH